MSINRRFMVSGLVWVWPIAALGSAQTATPPGNHNNRFGSYRYPDRLAGMWKIKQWTPGIYMLTVTGSSVTVILCSQEL
ncbi:MAG TPA: hypothetical protein VFA71_08155 [Terriglobales bacterium]|nr:hypothetical protein [Terriglobales bacterium]